MSDPVKTWESMNDEQREGVMKIIRRFSSIKVLAGTEYDHTKTMLSLIEPDHQSNNQHTWTDTYILNGLQYDVTYVDSDSHPDITVRPIDE